MIAFLRALFAPSVDKILGDFHKIVDKLEKAVDFHQTKADAQAAAQVELKKVEDAARAEVAKAQAAVSKIKALVS